ncbi:TRAP transporter fused permease subunit [Salipiger sp. P9]|uniref:TRAP transporter permease n=1 Tax=Salipiger pentaromativorans TaxID=2943193 RepID=UPI00215796CB|nr:TRAP transporter fused permease subunit [Salipiger pentaromativorans]MCR8547483.1 TRAP transporter fused permease subunit [Salipiger pentaromativorans]
MRELKGPALLVVTTWLSLAVLVHFYWAGFGFPEPLQLAALHVLAFLPPVFLLFPWRKAATPRPPALLDWALAALAIVPPLFVYLHFAEIYRRSTFLSPLPEGALPLGLVMIVLVIEAVRRALSAVLAGLVAVSLLYLWICDLLPGMWNYRDLPLKQIVEIQYYMVDSGVFGSLTRISATLIAAFLIFGAVMQASGMGRLFTNVGARIAGRYSGGPAKVAVISSGLFGTMSGSSVANVVVSGSITIPMMKKIGFRPALASAIEATASVGGPLMPPLMGAAAFVMSETTGIPYLEIISAAALIAVIYFLALLVNVHFEAKRLGIGAMAEDELPTRHDLLRDLHLVIPLAVLVFMLTARFSPYIAAFWCVLLTLGVSWLRAHTRMGPKAIVAALATAGQTICIVVVAVAAAGIITATLTQTGLVLAITGIIRNVAGDNLVLMVLLLALACLVMGMGIPTTPAYIITAAVGAPLLVEHGVSMLDAHLFVFYFAVLADVTPPVAGATYAAAAIGNAPPLRAGFLAFRLAIGGFLCGIAVAFDDALTFGAPLPETVAVALAILGGITLISAGIVGWFETRLPHWLRPLLIVAGLFCGLYHAVGAWERAALAGLLIGTLTVLALRSRRLARAGA